MENEERELWLPPTVQRHVATDTLPVDVVSVKVICPCNPVKT